MWLFLYGRSLPRHPHDRPYRNKHTQICTPSLGAVQIRVCIWSALTCAVTSCGQTSVGLQGFVARKAPETARAFGIQKQKHERANTRKLRCLLVHFRISPNNMPSIKFKQSSSYMFFHPVGFAKMDFRAFGLSSVQDGRTSMLALLSGEIKQNSSHGSCTITQ